MGNRADQIEMERIVESESDQHLVLDTAGTVRTGTFKGPSFVAQEMTIQLAHNPITDVMFVDLCPVQDGDHVDIMDVGETLGFPGQIQVRVDRQKEIFYGLTIQNYSGFRRKLLWRYRMWSMTRAIQLLVSTLLVGLGIDQDSHHGRSALPC